MAVRLEYLHKNDIAHRDLKSEKVLVSMTIIICDPAIVSHMVPVEPLNKLTDFGLNRSRGAFAQSKSHND